jgi:hypothetical protein
MRPPFSPKLGHIVVAAACSACTAGPPSTSPAPSCTVLDLPGDAGARGPGFDAGLVLPTCATPCTDFPSTPILDGEVPPGPGALFGPPGAFTATLCVVEPELSHAGPSGEALPGALFPADWVRPRFRVKPANGEDLFEIRIHVQSEANELVAYTAHPVWKLPADLWTRMGIGGAAVDRDITVTLRGVNSGAPGTVSGAMGTFRIAPVTAGGSIVYRATTSANSSPTSSKLVGCHVGDEATVDVLTIPEIQQTGILSEDGTNLRGTYGYGYGVPHGHVQCIGCHVVTPDGTTVGITDAWPWENVLADVQTSIGGVPSWLSTGAQRLLQQPWQGMMTMSPAHWAPGDRIALSSYEDRDGGAAYTATDPDINGASGKDRLAWFDLETDASIPPAADAGINEAIVAAEGRAYGFLDLQGETAGVISPSWSHDGKTIAYTSATRTLDGRVGDDAETDIHLVPYNDRAGGVVTPLAGAATPGVSEYYPAFSPDDRLIAFNRAGGTRGPIYYRPDGEVYVVPLEDGGAATRLAANDPPACTGETSPGVINSWPRWSPAVVDPVNGKTYYWVIFSSARDYPCAFRVPPNPYSPPDTRASQVYLAAVVVDQAGIHSYPAVYLWSQDPTASNLTPTWDAFPLPQP